MPFGNSTSLAPMTSADAKTLVRRFLGGFPSLNLHDPEVYITDLCLLLITYPKWIGEKVLDQAKDKFTFPPTRAELRPMLEENMRIPRYAAEWNAGARRLVEDRSRPRLEGPKTPRPTYEELKAKYGPNWGIGEAPKAPRQELADLCAKHGVSVDNIPDAKRQQNAQKLGRVADKIASTLEEKIDDWDVWP